MKIVQIVGRSNTGKTTFIKKLIPVLKEQGSVAVIKHLGDHDYKLEEGKDTTGFFTEGADIAVGIDAHKSVIAIHNTSLDEMLSILCNEGMDFVIIEGFKTRTFPKIVIGDLASEPCVLRNPTTAQVVASLPLFEDYYNKKV
jgi:molybdopterin-guanine dinucleotide biosynthesis protein MobB